MELLVTQAVYCKTSVKLAWPKTLMSIFDQMWKSQMSLLFYSEQPGLTKFETTFVVWRAEERWEKKRFTQNVFLT